MAVGGVQVVEVNGDTQHGVERDHVLTDEAEQTYALQMLLDKYFPHLRPGEDYRAITPEELRQTAAYRLDIEQWSGKQKQVEADFPGAFYYGEPPSLTF